MFDILPFLPFFSVNDINVYNPKKMIKNFRMAFFAMVPWHLQQDNLFCLPHHNIRWIMKWIM